MGIDVAKNALDVAVILRLNGRQIKRLITHPARFGKRELPKFIAASKRFILEVCASNGCFSEV
jgi:hypothetical protein